WARAELGPQRLAQVPQGPADDPAGVVDRGVVLGPVPLEALRVELSQRALVALEEPRPDARRVGDGRAEEVGDALGERAVEAADPGDQALEVHVVAELVVDDIADP